MKLHVNFMRSSNGKRDVAYYVYVPDEGPVRGIVQISHGMCDYVENYALFAQRLTSAGIVVCGNDHLGHGNTAEDERDLGYFGSGGFVSVVKDLRKMNKIIRSMYKGVPLVLFGHSMGSFMARYYVTAFPNTVDGAIFAGTAGTNNPAGTARALAVAIGKSRGNHYRSQMLHRLAFKTYNQRFPSAGEFAWLSRDPAAGRKYENDPKRNFIFTASGFYGLFSVLYAVSKESWAVAYPKNLPTLLMAGDMDPVGNYGKGPSEVYERLVRAGVKNVQLKLYKDARHELHNETNKEEFFADVIGWIKTNDLLK